MGISISHNQLRGFCIICFRPADIETLCAHHHCCMTGHHCEERYLQIVEWERDQFINSYLERIVNELIASY